MSKQPQQRRRPPAPAFIDARTMTPEVVQELEEMFSPAVINDAANRAASDGIRENYLELCESIIQGIPPGEDRNCIIRSLRQAWLLGNEAIVFNGKY